MIKQIWFIRNQNRLMDWLCFAVSFFNILYSALNLLAIADVETTALNTDFKFAVMSHLNLMIIPIVSIIFCLVIYQLKRRLRGTVKTGSDKKEKLQYSFKSEALGAANLYLMICALFLELDMLSKIKNISGFGLFPLIIFSVFLVLYYIYLIKKHLKS